MSKLTAARADAVYKELRTHGARKGKSLAASTVQRAHDVLHRDGQAVKWGWSP